MLDLGVAEQPQWRAVALQSPGTWLCGTSAAGRQRSGISGGRRAYWKGLRPIARHLQFIPISWRKARGNGPWTEQPALGRILASARKYRVGFVSLRLDVCSSCVRLSAGTDVCAFLNAVVLWVGG